MLGGGAGVVVVVLLIVHAVRVVAVPPLVLDPDGHVLHADALTLSIYFAFDPQSVQTVTVPPTLKVPGAQPWQNESISVVPDWSTFPGPHVLTECGPQAEVSSIVEYVPGAQGAHIESVDAFPMAFPSTGRPIHGFTVYVHRLVFQLERHHSDTTWLAYLARSSTCGARERPRAVRRQPLGLDIGHEKSAATPL